ncbi:uncharacterized protein LOC143153824 [Ptiloglossa arizonensis]|uniref:uncharacterized protein LOC143153824 n=1 Tax=Ptiloglossa arizonensis TaxID=3350558 RepID=UPI003F9F64FC
MCNFVMQKDVSRDSFTTIRSSRTDHGTKKNHRVFEVPRSFSFHGTRRRVVSSVSISVTLKTHVEEGARTKLLPPPPLYGDNPKGRKSGCIIAGLPLQL